jgi:TPP-dependent pyruvate/acetoin dehydrogenase alpha subunit
MKKHATAKDIPEATLRSMYVTMLTIRRFEEKAGELVRNKEIRCPTHLYIGQEAIATGVCANLKKTDWVFSTHRNHGHYIAKGCDLKSMMAECFGKATGSSGGRGGSMHISEPEIGLPGSPAILSGSIPIAVGAALAFSLKKAENVSVAFFGEGAVDEGTFHESLNFASLMKLPVIFICENNLYATHMPVDACLADTEVYQKAASYAIPGFRIDGNSVIEVYESAGIAVEAARSGKGPTLLECMTYRWRGHVGPNTDVDKNLRSQEELDYWVERCPIKALDKIMTEKRMLSGQEKQQIETDIARDIENAVDFARESPYPDEKELLNNVFRK